MFGMGPSVPSTRILWAGDEKQSLLCIPLKSSAGESSKSYSSQVKTIEVFQNQTGFFFFNFLNILKIMKLKEIINLKFW